MNYLLIVTQVNRLRKTKKEEFPDFAKMLEDHLKNEREKKKKSAKEKARAEKVEIEKKRIEQEAKSYDSLFGKTNNNNKKKKPTSKKTSGTFDDVFEDEHETYDGSTSLDDLF
jgi:hypothetical protein